MGIKRAGIMDIDEQWRWGSDRVAGLVAAIPAWYHPPISRCRAPCFPVVWGSMYNTGERSRTHASAHNAEAWHPADDAEARGPAVSVKPEGLAVGSRGRKPPVAVPIRFRAPTGRQRDVASGEFSFASSRLSCTGTWGPGVPLVPSGLSSPPATPGAPGLFEPGHLTGHVPRSVFRAWPSHWPCSSERLSSLVISRARLLGASFGPGPITHKILRSALRACGWEGSCPLPVAPGAPGLPVPGESMTNDEARMTNE